MAKYLSDLNNIPGFISLVLLTFSFWLQCHDLWFFPIPPRNFALDDPLAKNIPQRSHRPEVAPISRLLVRKREAGPNPCSAATLRHIHTRKGNRHNSDLEHINLVPNIPIAYG